MKSLKLIALAVILLICRSASGASVADAITPEIQALARGLENDPKRIFDYVHDHIRFQTYFGCKKGAQLTLSERSGSDWDQCALLSALLRSAGYTNLIYLFSPVELPYEGADHKDFKRWVGATKPNTNWNETFYFAAWLVTANGGYPYIDSFFANDLYFHHAWVQLTLGGTNFWLDPSFKASEPVAGIDLGSAMGLSTNDLLSAAGGTNTADYAQNLNEAALRAKLSGYTTNLLGYLQSNYPNASVDQILGGQQIVSSASEPLGQLWPFYPDYNYIFGLTEVPTAFMDSLTVTLDQTNRSFYLSDLGAQRLSLTFNSNGLAQLWLEDQELLREQTTGAASTISVNLSVHHPHGHWIFSNNSFYDDGFHSEYKSAYYVRTNSTYILLHSFDPDSPVPRKRQDQLDAYRSQGLADSSRQVLSETLNVLGVNWLLQTELASRTLALEGSILPLHHHRMGRVGQVTSNGYYIDVNMQLSAPFPSAAVADANSVAAADMARENQNFQLETFFGSAFEHGVIEQMQSSNLVAASTVKFIQLANTNGQKIFLANSTNWTTGANVRGQLTNYDLSIWDSLISTNYSLFLPENGSNYVAGVGSRAGYSVAAFLDTPDGQRLDMLISGGFNGGFAAFPVPIDSAFISLYDSEQSPLINPYVGPINVGDPVRIADGALQINSTDLSLGQREPRGFTFFRNYSSTRRYQNLAGMANGWVHSYFFNLAEVSGPLPGLGTTTPAQMASMLVAARAAIGLHQSKPDPKNWLLTTLIANWAVDQLINNSVSISLGSDAVQFIRQPDGSLTPPASSTMTLTKANSAYVLSERHGSSFRFGANNLLTNIADQYNQNLFLSYNSSNWVTQITDWKSNALTLNYTGTPLRLSSLSESTGRSVSYGYTNNPAGQLDLASVTDPEQKTSTFICDTNHQIIATLNALSQTVSSNLYDSFGRVVTQYSQGDTNKIWQFLWSGYANVEVDPAGSKRRFLFDDKSRQIGFQDALGNLTQTIYDGQDHVIMTVSPLNETNQFLFDGFHNMIASIDALGFTKLFVYDTLFNLLFAVDQRGNTNSVGYNAHFQLVGSTNAAGGWFTLAYNSTDGTLSGRTDSGGTTSYGHDSYGLVNLITYPGSLGSEGSLNNALGDVLSHTNARGFVTSFQYNQRRQLTNAIAPTNVTSKVTLDTVGNVQSVTGPRGFSTSNTWSATRKLLTTTLPAVGAPVLGFAYDNRDWLLRTTNALGKTAQFASDAAGRLFSVSDPLGRTSFSGYDADGRLTATTNAAQEVTKREWSARNELTKTTDPATNIVLNAYDPAGNQTDLTNRNSKRWRFFSDAANRVTNTLTPLQRSNTVTFNDRGLPTVVRQPSGSLTTNCFDARARLTNRTDAVGVTLITPDANGNITSVVEAGKTNSWTFDAYDRVSTYRDADGNLIQYRTDANGNVTNLIYPGGKTVTYAFDSLNRVTNVTDWAMRQTSVEYDLAGRVKKITRPNGTVREVYYNAAGETTNIIERTTTGAGIAFFKLGWTNSGRIVSEFSAPLPHAYTPPSRTMSFDDDNRLALLGVSTVTNDANGNMVWGPATNSTLTGYTYDARNRLLGVGSFAPGYDPAGNRTSVTNGTNVVRFVVNPNAALSQVLMRIQNGVTNYYVYGLGLLYEADDAGNTRTYHYDYRGSTVAITDGIGRVIDRIEYSAYGLMTYRGGSTDTPFLFNGRYGVQTDPSGLLYMRARFYNPYICRFISADPAGFAGGLNLYAYADGNPVSLIDPFGLGAGDSDNSGYWIDVGNEFKGLGDVLGRLGIGFWNFFFHPIRTSEAINAAVDNALDHPLETGRAVTEAVRATLSDLDSTDPRRQGQAVGNVLATAAAIAAPYTRAGQVAEITTAAESTLPQYYIENGVRRSVASLQAGASDIPATIYVEGQAPVTTTVPLNQLFSPKTELPLDTRFLNIRPPIQTPIQLQPLGLPGQLPTVPLNQVKLVPPGG